MKPPIVSIPSAVNFKSEVLAEIVEPGVAAHEKAPGPRAARYRDPASPERRGVADDFLDDIFQGVTIPSVPPNSSTTIASPCGCGKKAAEQIPSPASSPARTTAGLASRCNGAKDRAGIVSHRRSRRIWSGVSA